jgi:hypothetical protein
MPESKMTKEYIRKFKAGCSLFCYKLHKAAVDYGLYSIRRVRKESNDRIPGSCLIRIEHIFLDPVAKPHDEQIQE